MKARLEDDPDLPDALKELERREEVVRTRNRDRLIEAYPWLAQRELFTVGASTLPEQRQDPAGLLPRVISRVGGALREVFLEIDKYSSDGFPLSRGQTLMLGHLVEQIPGLNVESDVVSLIDIMSFHGIDVSDRETLHALLQTYSAVEIAKVLNDLWEHGLRSRGETLETVHFYLQT